LAIVVGHLFSAGRRLADKGKTLADDNSGPGCWNDEARRRPRIRASELPAFGDTYWHMRNIARGLTLVIGYTGGSANHPGHYITR
jgi:hypothetical protein